METKVFFEVSEVGTVLKPLVIMELRGDAAFGSTYHIFVELLIEVCKGGATNTECSRFSHFIELIIAELRFKIMKVSKLIAIEYLSD